MSQRRSPSRDASLAAARAGALGYFRLERNGVIWPQVSAGAVRYIADPIGADPPGGAELLNQHLDEHPIVHHYRTTGDGSAVLISDFLSARQ